MVNAVVTISRSQQRFAQCAELQSRLAGLMRTRLSKSFFKAFCTGVMSPIPSYRFAKIRPWERVAAHVGGRDATELSFDRRIAVAFNGEIYNRGPIASASCRDQDLASGLLNSSR